MRRIFAQARKELTQLLRDWRSFGLAIILPLVLLFLMSTAISFTATNIPIVVQDLDDSATSRAYVEAFRQSLTFRVVPWPVNRKPEQALISDQAKAALIIPPHFSRDLDRGLPSPAQLLVDASDANTARIIGGSASGVTLAFNQDRFPSRSIQPVVARIRLWYNPGRSSKKFFGPGVFVLALSMFPPLLAALAMSKEAEQKTILQVYASSIPVNQFLLGKILAFLLVAGAEAVAMLVALFTYFGLSFAGDSTPFWVATVLYAFCVSSFGIMTGAAIPSQAGAIQATATGGFLLVFLLSGLMFPVENIPAGIRWLSNFVWGRYYIEVVRDALLVGGGWPATWRQVAVIALIGGIFYFFAWLIMRRMQLKA
jgi:ABC-2 type transport system permease protein